MRPFRPLLLLLAGAACGSPAPTDPAPAPRPAPAPAAVVEPWTKYTALLGDWVDSTSDPRFRVYEHWRAIDDSTMSGNGYVLAGKDTVFVEDLKLARTQGQVTYSARIDTRNNSDWVPFAALPGGPDSLLFENPGHDFPQCILYVRDAMGRLTVRVNGVEKGHEREETFVYTRRGL